MSPRDILIQNALLRTVAFFDAIDVAPTWGECLTNVEWRMPSAMNASECAPPSGEELVIARTQLVDQKRIEMGMGRLALAGRLARHLTTAFERMPIQSRKLLRAHRVAQIIAHLDAVRFVALANTTSLGFARDGGDLDLFVVTASGNLWLTRGLAVTPYRMLGKLATSDAAPDAVCFSYFVTDARLDLSPHTLAPDDPYFRYWFLSLLPLYDDGVGEQLWRANQSLLATHPRASAWMVPPALTIPRPRLRIPRMPAFESLARAAQMRWFPTQIKTRMNTDTTVIVSDDTLKFHTDDGRLAFRAAYQDRLHSLGIDLNS